MLLLLAALPTLFWDGAPETARTLINSGITRIAVPASEAGAWKSVSGISVETADPAGLVKLKPPSVDYRVDLGGATRAPWLNSNGWLFLRQPGGRFYYDVHGPQAALAAAEAFSFGSNAFIRTDADGLKPFAGMVAFLAALPEAEPTPAADIGFIDDKSAAAGEVMNLLVRDNLLFRIVTAPDAHLKLTVRLGSKDYPMSEAKNPGMLAHLIRANLSDDRRSLRIYGSQVVVARLTGSGGRRRLQLLNYAGVERKVNGIRVRLLGRYENHQLAAAGSPGEQLLDYTLESDATEFTLPELKTYAVIDLSK
jgi:hypothetical protein